MSRVFVSCSYRDRAVGAELGSIVRSLGHDPEDDHDDARGTAWWNEVVGRIEASDVFLAVASPAYADAAHLSPRGQARRGDGSARGPCRPR